MEGDDVRNFLLTICVVVTLAGCSTSRKFTQSDNVPVTSKSVAANGDSGIESSALATEVAQSTSITTDQATNGLQDPPTLSLVSNSEDAPSQELAEFQAAQSSSFESSNEPIVEDLTLAEAEQLALAHNPTLLQLQNQITAARGQWIQGGLKPNPVLSLTSQEVGNEGSAGQNGVSLSQTIVTAGKLGLNQKVSAWDIRRNQLLLQVQQQRLLTDIRKQFYVTAIAQQRIAVSEKLLSIAAEGEEQARRLVQVQEPLTVLKQAQVEAQLARIQLQNANIQAMAEWSNLTTLIGQPLLLKRQLNIDRSAIETTLDFELLLQDILASSPERAAANAAQQRAAWAVRRACAGATPNLQIQGGAFHDDSTHDSFANVQLSIPLTVHDVNQGRILEAQANLASAAANVRKVELQIRQRLISAVQKYESAMQQWDTYETQILPTAQQNLELTKAAFLSGDSSYLPVLTAQRSFTQVQLASLNAQQQLGVAKARIDGKLLEGSL